METSWYGLFDLDPKATLEVRAGDLQAFLRQQMMGVTNPGLTVATADERKDNVSAIAQRLRDCKHREFNDGMDVEYAIEEAIGYNGGSLDGLFDSLADLVGSSEFVHPEQGDDEIFCTIAWSRADIVEAIERATGVRLDRDGLQADSIVAIIDHVVNHVAKGLQDRSVEYGWEVIDALMPDDITDAVNGRSFAHDLSPTAHDDRRVTILPKDDTSRFMQASDFRVLDGYTLLQPPGAAAIAVKNTDIIRTDNGMQANAENVATVVLETNDFVWYADDDNEQAIMFTKDTSGRITDLASDNYFAMDALDEACEQAWTGVLQPVYVDTDRLNLAEQARSSGWTQADSLKPSQAGISLKTEAQASKDAAQALNVPARRDTINQNKDERS